MLNHHSRLESSPAFPELKNGRNYKNEIKGAIICIWLVIVLMPLSTVIDYFIYPRFVFEFAIMKFVLVVFTIVIGLHIRFASKKYPLFCIFFISLCIVFVFSLMSNLTGEGYESGYYVGVIIVMVALVTIPLPPKSYYWLLFAIYLTYLTTLHFIFPVPFELRYSIENNGCLLLTLIILIIAHRNITKLREEVKTLSGFLPICMYCKKIRDDEGYWKGLEKFLSMRADVSFSHGICPQCHEIVKKDLDEINEPAEERTSLE